MLFKADSKGSAFFVDYYVSQWIDSSLGVIGATLSARTSILWGRCSKKQKQPARTSLNNKPPDFSPLIESP
jgi:hypothetical protein